MSNVFHVDGFVNLNHIEENQFNDWISKADAEKEFRQVVDLVADNAKPRDVQRALLDLEERTHSTQVDVPGVYRFPKDLRIEVTTDKEHITMGWHDNGGSSSCYYNSEKHRH